MEKINLNKSVFFVVMIFMLLSSSILWAVDYGEWEDLNGPYYLPVGNYIDYGERDETGSYVYAGKMYMSEDNGSNWELIDHRAPWQALCIDAHKSASDTLWWVNMTGSDRGAYLSFNVGQTYRHFNSQDGLTNDFCQVIDLYEGTNNCQTVLVGCRNVLDYGVVWKTTDAGDNWNDISPDQWPNLSWSVYDLQMAPADPNLIYAWLQQIPGDAGFLHNSTDGGNSWNLITVSFDKCVLSFKPTTNNVLFIVKTNYLGTASVLIHC